MKIHVGKVWVTVQYISATQRPALWRCDFTGCEPPLGLEAHGRQLKAVRLTPTFEKRAGAKLVEKRAEQPRQRGCVAKKHEACVCHLAGGQVRWAQILHVVSQIKVS